MQSEKSQVVSYRVPTGAEINAFVKCLNLAISVGHKLTYCQSGHETVVRSVIYYPIPNALAIRSSCGNLIIRKVELLSCDSFAFEISGSRSLTLCPPSWFGGVA
jgi:hypothetical protein